MYSTKNKLRLYLKVDIFSSSYKITRTLLLEILNPFFKKKQWLNIHIVYTDKVN